MDDINDLLRRHEPDRPDDIKNDEVTELNAIIMELEEYDAVVTVLAYFNYYQCQPTDDEGSMARYIRMRNGEDPMATERIYGLGKKMFVIVLAYFNYFS